MWLRPRQGANKKMWKKSPQQKLRSKTHVFCNATQSQMLDKMVSVIILLLLINRLTQLLDDNEKGIHILGISACYCKFVHLKVVIILLHPVIYYKDYFYNYTKMCGNN